MLQKTGVVSYLFRSLYCYVLTKCERDEATLATFKWFIIVLDIYDGKESAGIYGAGVSEQMDTEWIQCLV